MQKYGFTFKTVMIGDIKICLFLPSFHQVFFFHFPNFNLYFYQVRLCVYMQSMHGLVGTDVCSMGTAGKEVVLAGITWFFKVSRL